MNLERLRKAAGVASGEDVRAWRKRLRAHRDELLEALQADTGKHPDEGFLIEWEPIESALKFLEQNVDGALGPRVIQSALNPLLGRRHLVQRRIPHGRVLIVGTWNFPLSLHLTQILFAVAAGNRVTFKASPHSSHLAQAFARVLPEVLGVDCFEHWIPESDEICLNRVRERDFDLVIFTGGTKGAKAFARACGEAMIPLIAEASGSETALVLEQSLRGSGDVDRWVDHLLWGLLHHSGQTCVAPRFWLVPHSRAEAVWESAVRQLQASPESAISRSSLQHAGVAAEHAAWQEWAAALPGTAKAECRVRPEFSLFRLPRLKELPAQSPGTFGPSAIIAGYESLNEAVDWVLRSPWSLLTTVIGDPTDDELRALERLDTTVISFNETVAAAGDAAVPFGGRGQSGYGVCHGHEGLCAVSRVQTWQQVSPWPGAEWLKAIPSWAALPQLRGIGSLLRGFEDRPLETLKKMAVKKWMKRGG